MSVIPPPRRSPQDALVRVGLRMTDALVRYLRGMCCGNSTGVGGVRTHGGLRQLLPKAFPLPGLRPQQVPWPSPPPRSIDGLPLLNGYLVKLSTRRGKTE